MQDLPGYVGVPYKWLGYSMCPRPRIGTEDTLSGFALPKFLEPHRKRRISSKEKLTTPRLPERCEAPTSRLLASYATRGAFRMSSIRAAIEQTDTRSKLEAIESENRAKCLTLKNEREQLLGQLRSVRISAKGRYPQSGFPLSEGELYLRDRKRWADLHPNREKERLRLERVDRERLEKKRREKFPVFFSEREKEKNSENAFDKESTSGNTTYLG